MKTFGGLALVITSLLPACNLYAWGIARSVSLHCEPASQPLLLSCQISNTSDEPVWVLMAPFSLEGPVGHIAFSGPFKGEEYVLMGVGGERFENTLQYGVPTLESLSQTGPWEPVHYLSQEDLDSLVLLNAGRTLDFRIDLTTVPSKYFEAFSTWRFAPKVMVAEDTSLKALESSLPSSCRHRLASLGRHAVSDMTVSVEPRAWGRGFEIDDCFTPISEEFLHAFGGELQVNISTP